ncbi:hypothetical protein DFH06DRAFT_1129803 [Mycena polygramma]|nr:hypothetical protein DFH06DRAFT_1129803 [Mycena polygramma]
MSPVFSRSFPYFGDSDIPLELWTYIVELSLPDPQNFPASFAKRRGIMSCVCKEWKIYHDELFWSYLSVNQHVDNGALEYALTMCSTAPLRIRLSLMDLRIWTTRDDDDLPSVAETVHRLFDRLLPTASRWKAFYLYTENPEAFSLIQKICEPVKCPLLESITLQYYLMEGFSIYYEDNPIYFIPLQPARWFSGSPNQLRHVESYCASLSRDSIAASFSSLVSIDLGRTASSDAVIYDWAFFDTLFAVGSNLRFMRLGNLSAFPIPPSALLRSTSLLVLDVAIVVDTFLVALMMSMHVPRVTELVLRARASTVLDILPCIHILRQVTILSLHGDLGAGSSLYPLFDTLSSLRTLDMSCTKWHVVQTVFFLDVSCSASPPIPFLLSRYSVHYLRPGGCRIAAEVRNVLRCSGYRIWLSDVSSSCQARPSDGGMGSGQCGV